MAFHPDGVHAYVLNELASTINVFAYDPVRGALVWTQTVSTLPRDFIGSNTTAEIRVHPSIVNTPTPVDVEFGAGVDRP